MHDYRQALVGAIDAARLAGAVLREGLTQPGHARQFDQRAELLLRQRLRALRPWAYRSDEAGYLHGADADHLWLVDPNDGTFHYNRGARGSAVAVAALRHGVPVLGVVYAFAYPDHDGDLIAWAEAAGPILRNGRPVDSFLLDVPLDAPAVTFDDRLVVLLSPGADNYPHTAARRVAPARYVCLPSVAYRLALVAVGAGIATLSLNSPCAWDYAAGHALLRAAGGVFVDQAGDAITYTADGESTCDSCFAGGPLTVATLRQRPWKVQADAEPLAGGPPLLRPGRCEPARLSGRVVADAGVLARAQGCLLGQVAGDALGGLVEFESAESIRARYPGGCRDLVDGGTWQTLAGQPTDDSELALLLARTIVAAGEYRSADVLAAYIDWRNDPRTFDCGLTIARALSAAAQGKCQDERLALIDANANRASEANGSLMRVSPIGVHAAGRPELAAMLARMDSGLTHPNAMCRDSCAVFAEAIATAIATGCGPEATYRAALEAARRADVHPGVREAVEKARLAPPEDYSTQQGWVLIALLNAFYQLLHAPTLEDGVVATVMAGGDTDTTAAIAGALLGAVHGREAVPSRWRRCVLCCRALEETTRPRAAEYWPVDVLELAECLLLAGRAG